MDIYCCECRGTVAASLVDGSTIYPHRNDLHKLPFWQCPHCKNYVGCHHKTKDRTKPLGVIPTAEIRKVRQRIHAIIDPLWKNRIVSREWLYKRISDELAYSFHTAHISSIQQAYKELHIAKRVAEQITKQNMERS